MAHVIPIKSLSPNELAIAGKAFDGTMNRIGADSSSLKQDIAADVLAQIAAGETDAERIAEHALEHLKETAAPSSGARLELRKKDVL